MVEMLDMVVGDGGDAGYGCERNQVQSKVITLGGGGPAYYVSLLHCW